MVSYKKPNILSTSSMKDILLSYVQIERKTTRISFYINVGPKDYYGCNVIRCTKVCLFSIIPSYSQVAGETVFSGFCRATCLGERKTELKTQ